MNAEAIIIFDRHLAADLAIRHKRAGLLTSKMRFSSAQLLAYLEGELWRKNAIAANTAARRPLTLLTQLPRTELLYKVETKQIFASLSKPALHSLDSAGILFRRWGNPGPMSTG